MACALLDLFMSDRRVVITGMGAVTPLGQSVDKFWDGLVDGASGVGRVTLFDTTGFGVSIGAECSDADFDSIDRKTQKRLDRNAIFALLAAREAFDQSGLPKSSFNPKRSGAIVGTGIGGLWELETQKERLLTKGPRKVSAFTIPRLMVNAAAGNVSMELGLHGPSNAVGTACASAADAMGVALDAIRHNRADVIVTGGTEAALCPLGLSAFAAMKALSSRECEPAKASCPFDSARDGFVLGEGSGILVFEELEHAKQRGARVFAEVLGYGASSDAGHITQPHDDGRGGAEAMEYCMADATISRTDVQYINVHGTSTPLGDLAETQAIKRVFGDHVMNVAVSSTKSSIGHLLGASGGVELIACVQAINNGIAPPTINLHEPDTGCDLDYIPNKARDMRIDVAMSNSFGFGGHNACLAVGRYSG